jgi:hypothetical protein
MEIRRQYSAGHGAKGEAVVIKRSLTAILALLVALGSLTAGAQRPDHGGGRTTSPSETGTPVAAFCSGVETYATDLEEMLEDDGVFLEFVFSDIEFDELPAEDAAAIVEDGDSLIASLKTLDVPPPYLPAHEGIILFFQNMIDFTRFYTVDSSTVPDILGFDTAMSGIYEGEMALAEACPEEVDEMGGFLFISPATLEDEYGPDQ